MHGSALCAVFNRPVRTHRGIQAAEPKHTQAKQPNPVEVEAPVILFTEESKGLALQSQIVLDSKTWCLTSRVLPLCVGFGPGFLSARHRINGRLGGRRTGAFHLPTLCDQ